MSAFPSARISLPRTAPHRTVGRVCSTVWRAGPILFLFFLLKAEFVHAHSTGSECIVPEGVVVGQYQTTPGWSIGLANRTCVGHEQFHTQFFHAEAADCIAFDRLCLASQQSNPNDYTLQSWGADCLGHPLFDACCGTSSSHAVPQARIHATQPSHRAL